MQVQILKKLWHHFSADDVQISQLNETMEMIINFVPNLFLVKDDDDEEEDGVQQKVDELRQTLAQLIKQVISAPW